MRSIERKFQTIAKKNPNWSSWTVFAQTVKECELTPSSMSRYFTKLVEKSDYQKSDRNDLVQFLGTSKNMLRTTEFGGKTHISGGLKLKEV